MIAPAAWAIVFDVPRMPEMRPWRCGGTRSAIIALVAARYAFSATCRTSHPISKGVKSALIAKITRPRVAPTAPPKIQGERLPKRLLVRSERAPKTMFAMSATIDPTMVRIPKAPGGGEGEGKGVLGHRIAGPVGMCQSPATLPLGGHRAAAAASTSRWQFNLGLAGDPPIPTHSHSFPLHCHSSDKDDKDGIEPASVRRHRSER